MITFSVVQLCISMVLPSSRDFASPCPNSLYPNSLYHSGARKTALFSSEIKQANGTQTSQARNRLMLSRSSHISTCPCCIQISVVILNFNFFFSCSHPLLFSNHFFSYCTLFSHFVSSPFPNSTVMFSSLSPKLCNFNDTAIPPKKDLSCSLLFFNITVNVNQAIWISVGIFSAYPATSDFSNGMCRFLALL